MPRKLIALAAVVSVAIAWFAWEAPQAPRPVETIETPAETFERTHAPDQAVSADGVLIQFDDRGRGEKTVVFIHGWAANKDYWQLQRDFLAETYRVVSVNLAGHGDSEATREQWSMAAFADDVVAVIEQLDLSQVSLVGHAMGSSVALEVALRLPTRVERVVAVEALHSPGEQMSAAQLGALIDNLEADYSAAVSALARSLFSEQSNPRIRDYVIRDMSASKPQAGLGALLASHVYDARQALGQLTQGLVLINSARRETNAKVLEDLVSAPVFLPVTGASHFPMLEEPVEFTERLLQALEQQD